MKARKVELILATYATGTHGEIDQRTRWTREHGLIPTGGRGNNAPELAPEEIATLILTIVPRRASDAQEITTRALKLRCIPRPTGESIGEDTLLTYLTKMLSRGSNIQRIEVACDGSVAWLHQKRGPFFVFSDLKRIDEHFARAPETYDGYRDRFCGHRVTFTSAFMDHVADEIEASKRGASREAQ